MFPTTAVYKEYIKKSSTEYDWIGTIRFSDNTSISFTGANIDQNKSKITRQCVSGENLEIGNVFSAELRLTLRDSETWKISDKSYDYYDAVVTISFRLVCPVPGVGYEDVLCGKFTITEAERTYHTVTLTAYDNANKLKKKMTEKFEGNYTPYNAIAAICGLCNLSLSTSAQTIASLPNGNRADLKMSVYKKGTSYRDVLGNICTILGCNAFVNRAGSLEVIQYGMTSVRALSASERYSTSYIDYIGNYTTIYAVNKKGEIDEYSITSPDYNRELSMNIGKNTLLNKYDSSEREYIIENILYYLSMVDYSPCSITMPCDPSIDISDMVSIIGGEITGMYTPTIDTTVDTNKTYYSKSGGTYTPVEPAGWENPQQMAWYELGASALCTKIEMPLFGQMKITSEAGSYELDIDPYATEKEEEKKKDNDENEDKWEEQGQKNDDNDDKWDDNDRKWEDQDDHNDDTDDRLDELGGEVGELATKLAINYIFPYEVTTGTISNGSSAVVLKFRFTCDRDGDTVSFYSMVTFTVETAVSQIEGGSEFHDCTLSVSYYIDGDLSHTVLHTYTDGHAILTLNGCYASLSQGEHTFNVEFAVSGGSIS